MIYHHSMQNRTVRLQHHFSTLNLGLHPINLYIVGKRLSSAFQRCIMRVQGPAYLGPATVRSAAHVQQILSPSATRALDFSALYQITTLNTIIYCDIGSCIYFENND